MKILLLHQYFLEDDDPGGSRWNEMAKNWTDQGHQITVIAGMVHPNGTEKRPEYKGKHFVKKKQGKVTVHRAHVSESYNKGFSGRLWGYFSFMFSSLWAGLFKVGSGFDVMIVTSPPLFVGITGCLLSFFKRTSMVFEVRDLWPESAIDTGVLTNKWVIRLAYWVELFIYKRSRMVCVLTPAFFNNLKETKGVLEDKLLMIPNAADFSLSEEVMAGFDREGVRRRHHLDGHFVITYVGAHGVANHLEQLIAAAKALEDTNVLFLMIGGGMEKNRLKELVRKNKVENIRFLDPVPKKDVFAYILASDMGTSVLKKVDTFKTVYSNKTFDYFSCKKPVLMGIDGVSRELVETARAGRYVEPENTEEYNRVVREYLNDPDRLRMEGENGYVFAKKNFDREVLANNYLEALKKVVN